MTALQNISDEKLILLAVIALLLHVVFLVLGRKIHILFLLVGVLGMLTNMSTSYEYEYVMVLKYTRVYVGIVVIALGYILYKKYALGSATIFLLLAAGMYWVSGLWSAVDPVYQFMYGSFFFMSVLAGGALANSVDSIERFHAGLRVVATIGVVAGVFYLTMYFVNPKLVTVNGRLAGLAGPAMPFSADCAHFSLVSIYLLFYDNKKSLKLLWCVGIVLLVLCILLSGSRTGFVLLLAGLGVFCYSKRRNPILVTTMVTVVAVGVAVFILSVEDLGEMMRIFEAGDNRTWVWGHMLTYVAQSPIIGFGSNYVPVSGSLTYVNPHSSLIKMLLRCGIIGFSFLAIAWMIMLVKMWTLVRMSRRYPHQVPLVTFLVVMTCILSLDMLPDHSIVAATTIGTTWLGFLFAMSERLVRKPLEQPESRRVLIYKLNKKPVAWVSPEGLQTFRN